MNPPGYKHRFPRWTSIAASALALLASASWGWAQPVVPDNSGVTMFVHLVPKDQVKRLNCFHHGVTTPETVTVQGDVPDDSGEPREYLAYLLIAGFDKEVGITAIQFGIAYDGEEHSGVDILGWQDCATLEWHANDWPGAGTGNLLTWNQLEECQKEEPVVVGMLDLQIWGPDRLVIIPRPVDQKALIAACAVGKAGATAEVKPENLGFAGFGEKRGYNPWDPKQNLLKLQQGLGQK